MNENSAIRGARSPVVFVSYASEDRPLAMQIATRLFEEGMEVFFDGWEIRAGDSIREKLDAGLGRCTHFVVLLTPRSVQKSWVRAEMDAAFVRRVEGECRFIPLRHDLAAAALPPLLRGLLSLQIDDFETDVTKLVEEIRSVDRRPSPPATAPGSGIPASAMGLSPGGAKIVGAIVRRSQHGLNFDPPLNPDVLQAATGLSDDAIRDAAEELIERGLVDDSNEIGQRSLGFSVLYPRDHVFALYDGFFMDWNPADDALRIAADLVNEGRIDERIEPQDLVGRYGWKPRRLNPALSYLALFGAAKILHAIGTAPFSCAFFWLTSKARHLLRDREPPFTARQSLLAKRQEILDIAERHKTFDLRLFGSSARGERAADSDLDIVVKLRPGASLSDLARLEGELASLLGYTVDVVDERSLRPSIRDKVLAEATPI